MPEHIMKLLGMLYPAEWPESTADPPGHNNDVIILHVI